MRLGGRVALVTGAGHRVGRALAGALVDHFGLVPSGGSDWHGAVEGPRVIGNQRVSAEWAERQEARAV
ncbi:MAG TPA: hypothetical protein VNS52_17980, partial [Gemmatimonadaceae bacterium]|nr:hypothetical protein [Gemmatimonadaceae bacterium]